VDRPPVPGAGERPDRLAGAVTASRAAKAVAVALVVVVVLLGVAAVVRGPLRLPVLAHLGATTVRIATLDAVVAVLVPPIAVALLAVLHAVRGPDRGAVLLAAAAASPIVLFVVARLNGIEDAAALVLVYASAAGGVLLRSLHRPGASPMPLRLWSVLGIVPWGVVAFTQIGGILAGSPPSAAVRVLTLLVLAAVLLEFVVTYRRRDRPLPTPVGLSLVALPAVLLAAGTIAAVR
jgi:hypothetical protein